MNYDEFRENVIISGFTFKSLAELLNMNPASLCNYSSKPTVPEPMAILSILLKEARLSSPSILDKLSIYRSCSMNRPSIKHYELSTNAAESIFPKADSTIKPVLKWAGGKSQLIPYLEKKIPDNFNTYIEPFIGGAALFFFLRPKKAIISDNNPELVNLYQVIAAKPKELLKELTSFKNEKDFYYQIRSMSFDTLDPLFAAARTIFLNKTCFNGLYRVNKLGLFNTPYGGYKRTTFVDEDNLLKASELLKRATILQADFEDVLENFAKAGDFAFLDPPYIPVSDYSDFNRYTKEKFSFDDQKRLANLATKLAKAGVNILLTNSNTPATKELYRDFNIEVVQTRRNISKKADKRNGEDAIIFFKGKVLSQASFVIPKPVQLNWNEQVKLFPPSRYMGSKHKLLPDLAHVFQEIRFDSALDLFSGSNSVSYLLKSLGKKVISNDYMAMNFHFAKAVIENSGVSLSQEKVFKLIEEPKKIDLFVSNNFRNLYFSEEDNREIDIIRTNISQLSSEYEISIAKSALIRAALKKRPRGIFTFTGFKYDDGRKDLKMSIFEHFREAIKVINQAVFDNQQENYALCLDALSLDEDSDLIYMDPPYCSLFSDNEYVRRYHFLEGLARDWKGVEIQQHTKTKKFKSYPTPFTNKKATYEAFEALFEKYKNKKIVLSYSSNSLPTKEELLSMLRNHGKDVEIFEINHKYSFGNQSNNVGRNQNEVLEYIFVAQ